MKEETKQTISLILRVIIAVATALTAAFGLQSCNVTRKITTESSFFQRGDTTTQIITKTTESYDARKQTMFNN